jgi:hypothetical protein
LSVAGALLWLGCAGATPLEVRGSGRVMEEPRDVGRFTGVALNTAGDLTIEIAEREELRIEAEDNLLGFLETDVVDGVLEIRAREGVVLSPTRPVRYRLAVRELNRIEHAAGGDVRIPAMSTEQLHVQHRGSGRLEGGALETSLLSVHLSGSGDVAFEQVKAQRSRLILSGSGNVRVEQLLALSNDVRHTGSGEISISGGSVVRQSAFVSGSGDLEGAGLRTSETEIMVSGSGSAAVYAEDQLDATITGQGDIHYRGNPNIRLSITGSGKLGRTG